MAVRKLSGAPAEFDAVRTAVSTGCHSSQCLINYYKCTGKNAASSISIRLLYSRFDFTLGWVPSYFGVSRLTLFTVRL